MYISRRKYIKLHPLLYFTYLYFFHWFKSFFIKLLSIKHLCKTNTFLDLKLFIIKIKAKLNNTIAQKYIKILWNYSRPPFSSAILSWENKTECIEASKLTISCVSKNIKNKQI